MSALVRLVGKMSGVLTLGSRAQRVFCAFGGKNALLGQGLEANHHRKGRHFSAMWFCPNLASKVQHIMRDLADLSHLAQPGKRIAVRATPKASRNRVEQRGGEIRVYVTVAPEAGKANVAVRDLLAKAMGIAKGRLRLIRGDTSRDKLFEVN